jgi:hypothetical protein
MFRTADLPSDVESLQRLVIESRQIIEATRAQLLSRELEIENSKPQLARLRRMQFDRSSEALTEKIAQLELTLEELESQEASLPAPAVKPRSNGVDSWQ